MSWNVFLIFDPSLVWVICSGGKGHQHASYVHWRGHLDARNIAWSRMTLATKPPNCSPLFQLKINGSFSCQVTRWVLWKYTATRFPIGSNDIIYNAFQCFELWSTIIANNCPTMTMPHILFRKTSGKNSRGQVHESSICSLQAVSVWLGASWRNLSLNETTFPRPFHETEIGANPRAQYSSVQLETINLSCM